MTPPTPAEQIRRFVEQHPGEWRRVDRRNYDGAMALQTAAGWLVLRPFVLFVSVTASRRGYDDHEFTADDGDERAPILAQVAARIADVCSAYAVPAEGLPPWLADPVRRELRRRAGELLTLAGSSPADVVSAAETLDEYLVSRGVVEVTGILPTLLEVGMSCRWAKGYDEADDYIGLVSRRLAAVAGECETLRATMKQAIAHLDAYDRSDGREALAPLNARAVLRRVLGVT